eukprot:scaffold96641_cov24-Attheya_sp.AAC.1
MLKSAPIPLGSQKTTCRRPSLERSNHFTDKHGWRVEKTRHDVIGGHGAIVKIVVIGGLWCRRHDGGGVVGSGTGGIGGGNHVGDLQW